MTSDSSTTRVIRIGVSLGACCVLLLSGCGRGPFDIAPVSGVVTLDGTPLENAAVRFQPQRMGDNPLVGPGSLGITDSEGRFTLKTHDGQRGAVVGQHRVSISTYDTRLVDPENSDKVEVVSKERVPKRYRSPSELRFEVPNRGARDATFELTGS